jgi:hypothetical protein
LFIPFSDQLCLVTIVLFRTLLDLNCEDVLYELVLRYLGSLGFLNDRNSSQLALAGDCSQLDHSARRLLSYMPCISSICPSNVPGQLSASDLERLEAISLDPSVQSKSVDMDNGYPSLNSLDSIERVERSLSAAITTPTLMDNFVEYLNDAHRSIRECSKACSSWSNVYSLDAPGLERNFDSGININSLSQKESQEENDRSEERKVHGASWSLKNEQLTCTEDYFDASEEIERELIGPFLSHLLTKLESVHQNDVCTNLQLTGLWARLLVFPQPLLRAYLLNDRVQVHPRLRTLWRSLAKNQQRLQRLASQCTNFSTLIDNSKTYFVQREQLLLDRIDVVATNETTNESNVNARASRSGSVSSEQITINIEPNKGELWCLTFANYNLHCHSLVSYRIWSDSKTDNKRNTLRNFWNKLRSDKTSPSYQREDVGFVDTTKSNQ